MLKLLLVVVAAIVAGYAMVIIRGFRKLGRRIPASQFPEEFATPHGALRMYQRAVANRDLDGMVAAKDFLDEATVMLRNHSLADAALLAETAGMLEAAFREQWSSAAWPDLSEASSFFSEALPLADDVVLVHHSVVRRNGEREEAQVRVVRRGAYWKVSHASG